MEGEVFWSHLHQAIQKVSLSLVAPIFILRLLPAWVISPTCKLPLYGQLRSLVPLLLRCVNLATLLAYLFKSRGASRARS